MKHIQKIQEILNNEIWDYSFNSEIELDYNEDLTEQYDVKITDRYNSWKLIWNIVLRTDWEKIEVELWEDNFEKIETYEWTIKYFWMALLMK